MLSIQGSHRASETSWLRAARKSNHGCTQRVPGRSLRGWAPREADEVAIDDLGKVHSRPRARVVPDVEPRVHLEEIEATVVRVPLEVELRHTTEVETAQDLAPRLDHVVLERDLERRAVAIPGRVGADLAAGELAGGLAFGVDVRVIALDQGLRPRNELLHQKLESRVVQPWPERLQLRRAFDFDRLPAREWLPGVVLTSQRLDDEWKPEVGDRCASAGDKSAPPAEREARAAPRARRSATCPRGLRRAPASGNTNLKACARVSRAREIARSLKSPS